jgi:Bcr/CflA subfamily drug resistance transporter
MWLLLLLVAFPQISETIYSPALPDIAHTLHTSSTLVQWTLSLYFVGFAIGVFIWGWASDFIGRRKAMLFGIVLYIIASVLCGSATNIYALLGFRLLQGLGGSVGSVLTQAIARESLSDIRRNKFFSMQGVVLALAITLGPFIGGYLTQWFDWRSNFIFLIIMGVLLLCLSMIKLKEAHDTRGVSHDVGLLEVLRQLLTDKHVLMCMWIVGVTSGFIYCYYAEAPFIFIKIIGISESQYGWLGFFIAIAALFGTMTSKKLLSRFDENIIMTLGVIVLICSAVFFLLVAFLTNIGPQHKILSVALVILPMMGFVFASFGFLMPISLSTALQEYKHVLGLAGACFGLGYYLIDAILTWIMGAITNNKVWPMPVFFAVLSLTILIVYYMSLRYKRGLALFLKKSPYK